MDAGWTDEHSSSAQSDPCSLVAGLFAILPYDGHRPPFLLLRAVGLILVHRRPRHHSFRSRYNDRRFSPLRLCSSRKNEYRRRSFFILEGIRNAGRRRNRRSDCCIIYFGLWTAIALMKVQDKANEPLSATDRREGVGRGSNVQRLVYSDSSPPNFYDPKNSPTTAGTRAFHGSRSSRCYPTVRLISKPQRCSSCSTTCGRRRAPMGYQSSFPGWRWRTPDLTVTTIIFVGESSNQIALTNGL